MTCELLTCTQSFHCRNPQLAEEGKNLWLAMTPHDYTARQREWQRQAVVIHSLGAEIAGVQRERITLEQRSALSNSEYRHYGVINQGSHPERRLNCKILCRGKLELQ